jgi:hypothetical protein
MIFLKLKKEEETPLSRCHRYWDVDGYVTLNVKSMALILGVRVLDIYRVLDTEIVNRQHVQQHKWS